MQKIDKTKVATKNIGKTTIVTAHNAYFDLAQEDEKVAKLLAGNACYRQASYHILQVMEKYIRARIFSMVNPKIQWFSENNRSHSLYDAVAFLLEVLTHDEIIRTQVQHQFDNYIFKNITNLKYLHNNLRYPSFDKRINEYRLVEISKNNFNELLDLFTLLKGFLKI